MKSFPIEYPAVLALATDFVPSVANAKTAGTPDNMCLKPITALPGGGDRFCVQKNGANRAAAPSGANGLDANMSHGLRRGLLAAVAPRLKI